MAAGDIALRILLTASAGSAVAQIGTLANALGSGGLAGAFVGVGIAAAGMAVAFGAASVSAADQFESSMAKIQAYVGMTKQQTDSMAQSVLQMAPELGQAPKALADGLYFVASAGFKGADALTVLRYAGMTAAAGNIDASISARALVSSLNALGLSAKDAGNISDELNATVKNGVMTWDEYGSVVGKIAGAVSAAGGGAKMMQANFTDLNAALDVYTNSGISAHQASMWLNADMSLLYGKTDTLAKNAAKLGISFDQSKFASMDFAQKLQYLNQITDGNRQELVKLLGGNSQVAQSVQFLNNHYGTLNSTIQNIMASMKNGKQTLDMFNVAQQTMSFQVARAQAAFQVLMVTVGSALLPILSRLIGTIATLTGRFTAWLASGHAVNDALTLNGKYAQIALPILSALAVVVGVGLALAFWNLAAAVIAATWPILLVAAAVAALVALFVHFYQTNAGFKAFIDNLVKGFQQLWQIITANFAPALKQVGLWLQTYVWPVLQQIGAFLVSTFTPVWQQLVSTWNSQLLPSLKQLWQALQPMMPTLKMMGQIILGVVVVALIVLVGALAGVVAGISTFLQGLIQVVGGVVQFFTGLIQFVQGAIQFIVDLCTGHFDKLGTDLQQIWLGIQNMWNGLWTAILGILQATVGTVTTVLQTTASTIANIFLSLYNALVGHSIVPDMVNGIVNWFAQLPGRVGAFVVQMVSNLLSQFGNMSSQAIAKVASFAGQLASQFANIASQALNWGRNIIQQLINGINSMLGALGSAVANAASKVAGALGFHSPTKEGPGRDSDKWAPAFVNMFASGLIAGIPKVTSASYQLSNAMNSALGLGSSNFAVNGGSFALQGKTTVVVQPGQAAPVYLDKRQVGQILFDYQASELRKQGTVRNR